MTNYGGFAVEIASQAGAMIEKSFQLGTARTIKADGSPVTDTDLAINTMVIDAIHTAFPGHSIIGEEESRTVDGSEWAWICDPLDGTVPFTHGIPMSTFSLALTHNGVPELAVTVDPYCNRVFFAERGQGATLNGKPITVSDETSLENQVVIFECPAFRPDVDASVRAALSGTGATVLTMRSSAYCSGLVACGELAGVIYIATLPWDGAAAAVIVDEAGGRVTDLAGNPQRYDQSINGYVASNGTLHEELLRCIGSVNAGE